MSDFAGIDTTETSTTQKYDINRIYRIKHPTYGGGAWEYGQADEAISAGQAVFIADSDGGLTLADTTEAGSTKKDVGIADADIASGSWGWLFRGEGSFEAILTNALAAGTNLTTTATGGTLGSGGDTVGDASSVDAGVTSTRVTIQVAGLLAAGS